MTIGHDVSFAAKLLREGGLVAFPTETVYGLGARADSSVAVRRIFEVKGRPAAHPLIVHICEAADLGSWVASVPEQARILGAAFWPGPLTLVLRRNARVSLEVTGGKDTVAVRVPQHPVALALLQLVELGIAAPSANRFTRVSPTRSEHVESDLGSHIDYILEGGPSEVGIESTIVDLSGTSPMILRPGGVTQEAIEARLGLAVPVAAESETPAPGQHPLHYAPRALVRIVTPEELPTLATGLTEQGQRVGVLTAGPTLPGLPANISVCDIPGDERSYARELYHSLRALDEQGVDIILTCLPHQSGIGLAVRDRLLKAAGPRNQHS